MNRGARAVLVVVIALIAAGVATYAVFQAIQRMPVREVEMASQPVVVAAKALPVGALFGPDDVKVAQWPSRSPVAGAFPKTEEVVGRGLMVEVAENEPITDRSSLRRVLAPVCPLRFRSACARCPSR